MYYRICLISVLLLPSLLFANPFYSIQDGSWSSATTWSTDPAGLEPAGPPTATDTVYIRHEVTHNTGGNYLHYGNVIIETNGHYNVNTGSGSSRSYHFRGNRFDIYGQLTTTSDFHHQQVWSAQSGLLYLRAGSSVSIGDDLILNGYSETILETEDCGSAGTVDDIYFKGTHARICGEGNFIVPDRMRAWNDSKSEVTPALTQIVNQICAGFQLYDDPGSCTNPIVTGGGSFVLAPALLDLSVSQQAQHCLIQWQAASVPGEFQYQLERSQQGDEFHRPINMSSPSPPDSEGIMSILDLHPIKGISYYRLSRKASDGTITYSPMVSFHYTPPHPHLKISPNPSRNERIRLEGIPSDQKCIARLYAPNGSMISESELPPSQGLELQYQLSPNLPPGLYLLEIRNPDFLLKSKLSRL